MKDNTQVTSTIFHFYSVHAYVAATDNIVQVTIIIISTGRWDAANVQLCTWNTFPVCTSHVGV